MGKLTNYAANKLIDHLFNTAYLAAGQLYLVLCSADPTAAATGSACNEISNNNGYGRAAISFGVAASRRITQDAQVVFPQATGPWNIVTHWAVSDSATYGAGNVLATGAFASAFAPVAGNSPRIASGQAWVEISGVVGTGFTTDTVIALLGLMFDNQAFASPAGSTYVALLNNPASDTTTLAGMAEVSGSNYSRLAVNPYGGASPTWGQASSRSVSNGSNVTMPTTGVGGWSQIVGMAVVTAAAGTSGRVLCYDNVNVVDQISAEGDTVQFSAGTLNISIN